MEERILSRSLCRRLALSSSDLKPERVRQFARRGCFWIVLVAKSFAAEYLVKAILPAFVHLNFFKTRSLQFWRIFEPRFRFLEAILPTGSEGIFRDALSPSSFPCWLSSSSCMTVKRETRDSASFVTFSGGT